MYSTSTTATKICTAVSLVYNEPVYKKKKKSNIGFTVHSGASCITLCSIPANTPTQTTIAAGTGPWKLPTAILPLRVEHAG